MPKHHNKHTEVKVQFPVNECVTVMCGNQRKKSCNNAVYNALHCQQFNKGGVYTSFEYESAAMEHVSPNPL